MKSIAMAVLMFGITSCAVETAPVSTSTADDDSAQTTDTTSTSSEAADLEASPLAVQCIDGTCESLGLCRATGGHVVGPCPPGGIVCCVLE